jgi:hypothetical protein
MRIVRRRLRIVRRKADAHVDTLAVDEDPYICSVRGESAEPIEGEVAPISTSSLVEGDIEMRTPSLREAQRETRSPRDAEPV